MKHAAWLFAFSLIYAIPSEAQPLKPYHVVKTVPLGAPDSWDYVVFDTGRVYIAHGDRVSVVDGQSGISLGTIVASGTTHGIGTYPAGGKGYTDDGKAGAVISFDLKTLQPLKRIKAEPDADGIEFDSFSGHILVIDGDSGKVTVIDPKTDTVLATIDGGADLEFGVSDSKGKFYVDGAAKNEIVRMDMSRNAVDAHWPLPGCVTPHGLAMDQQHRRLFASCANKVMVVVNADTGALLTTLPIGQGTDFAVFDPLRQLAFSSNREGTLSVIAETAGDHYAALEPVKTNYGARTMGIDPKTGRLYVVTADYNVDETVSPGDARSRYRIKPGSAKLLFLDPQ